MNVNDVLKLTPYPPKNFFAIRKTNRFVVFYGNSRNWQRSVRALCTSVNTQRVGLWTTLQGWALWPCWPATRQAAVLQLCVSSSHLTQYYRGAYKSLARLGRKQARKHVKEARYFNNIETRAVIKFFLQGKAPKEIHAILTDTIACFLPGRTKDFITTPVIFIFVLGTGDSLGMKFGACLYTTVKVRFAPCKSWKHIWVGATEVCIQSCSNSTQDGGECFASLPDRFTPGERSYRTH